jgi:hypothetical protein
MGTHDDPNPRPDDEGQEPDFARGEAETDPQKHGRFSTGEERSPEKDVSEEEVEPDFARGLAETDPQKHGRFSTGQEELPHEEDVGGGGTSE